MTKTYIVFVSFAGAKINAIKAIRRALGLGLKEAKDASEVYDVSAENCELIVREDQLVALVNSFAEEQTTRLGYTYSNNTHFDLRITRVEEYNPRRNDFTAFNRVG